MSHLIHERIEACTEINIVVERGCRHDSIAMKRSNLAKVNDGKDSWWEWTVHNRKCQRFALTYTLMPLHQLNEKTAPQP